MIDFTSMKGLAIGGAFAAVASAWGTIRNWLTQASALLVIRAHLDYGTAQPVLEHLKTDWKIVPSGISRYTSLWLTKVGTSKTLRVPFKSLNDSTVFYKGRTVIVAKIRHSELTIYGIRGSINFEDLIKKSIKIKDRHIAENFTDRFRIKTLSGMAGGDTNFMYGKMKKPASNKSQLIDSSSEAPISNDGLLTPDTLIDKSFLYEKSEYIYPANTNNPIGSLVYPESVIKEIETAKQWKAAESWYADRSIPWKTGTLFYGPGGTGKSTLAATIAKAINMPLYAFRMSTFSDHEFVEEWQSLDFPCVILFEDLDTVFDKRENITAHKSLSFETLLNQISGVDSHNGMFLIITTNRIEKIDEALGVTVEGQSVSTRPGRLDRALYVGPMEEPERLTLIKHILRDWPDTWESMLEETLGFTVAQVQEKCIQTAFKRMKND